MPFDIVRFQTDLKADETLIERFKEDPKTTLEIYELEIDDDQAAHLKDVNAEIADPLELRLLAPTMTPPIPD